MIWKESSEKGLEEKEGRMKWWNYNLKNKTKTENKHFVPKTYQYFISKNDTGEKKWLCST